MQFIDALICRFVEHVWKIETIDYDENKFVSLGVCIRCNDTLWVKGEHGSMKGVRFTRLSDEYYQRTQKTE